MKVKEIFVKMHDKDKFFTHGVEQIVKDNQIIKKDVQLVLNHTEKKEKHYEKNVQERIEITVYPSKDEISRVLNPCLRNGMCVFKEQTIEEINAVIENAVYHLTKDVAPPYSCKRCKIIELNAIEKKILLGMSKMLSQGEIASTLQLSLKVVSRHKRNAMKKLSLHNNSELKIYLLKHIKSVDKKGMLILSFNKTRENGLSKPNAQS